jgi:hypothetical protein
VIRAPGNLCGGLASLARHQKNASREELR